MMHCPLPIDWLEYLEGAGPVDFASHLSQCYPCQILVAELRRDKRPSLRVANVPAAGSWPRWNEVKDAAPRLGDIWWTTSSFGPHHDLPRIPVLLVSDAWQEKGRSWCELVPLSSDLDSATALDLLILPSDTDMNVPWRALLRNQTIGEISDLDSRIGCLTASGEATLRMAIEGRAPANRFGLPVEGAEDPRPRLPEDWDQPIKLIGARYAELLEGSEQSRSARILMFRMQPVIGRRDTAGAQLSLAASTNVEPETPHWSVDIPERGRVQGRIDHDFITDELRFVIENIVEDQFGLGSTAWVAAWTTRLSEPVTSGRFDPTRDREVLISKGLEVFPQEITRVEFRLPDET